MELRLLRTPQMTSSSMLNRRQWILSTIWKNFVRAKENEEKEPL